MFRVKECSDSPQDYRGTVASVPPPGWTQTSTTRDDSVDAKNILFIVGGAFDGIEEIVKQRLGEKKSSVLAKITRRLTKAAPMQEIIAEDIQRIWDYP